MTNSGQSRFGNRCRGATSEPRGGARRRLALANSSTTDALELAVLAFFALATAAWLARDTSPRSRAIGVGVLVVLIAVGWSREATRATADHALLPSVAETAGFTSSSSCRACHPSRYASWHQSYHRTMTQAIDAENALGDFDDVTLVTRGRTTRLWRRGRELWCDTVDPYWEMANQAVPAAQLTNDPPRVTARVVMATGSHHLQTYWLRRPADPSQVAAGLPPDDGAYHQLPWTWDVAEARWIPTQDSFLTPPSERVEPGLPWNTSCNLCHSVGTSPHLTRDPEHGREVFHTSSVELGIACESCHGPAESHVDLHRSPWQRYRRHLSGDDEADATIVDPRRLTKARSTEVCGQCHSFHKELDLPRWRDRGVTFRPGDVLADTKRVFRFAAEPTDPVLLQHLAYEPDALAGRFWKDGTIRVAGREYNGLLESACHTRGEMSCLSCHASHAYEAPADQLRADVSTQRACVACHAEIARDVPAHTHHAAGSGGSDCVNCHMPHTTWGLFTAMRSHRIDSPSAKTSFETGRPNACNQCHVDRPLQWTADQLAAWYGHERLTLPAKHREVSATVLWTLEGDAAQRAIAAWTLGWEESRRSAGADWQPLYLGMLLTDPYAAVRRVAVDALRRFPTHAGFAYDFVASPGQQTERARAALGIWQARRVRLPESRAANVLLDAASGEPLRSRIAEFSAHRDDTPLRIIE